MYDTLDRLRLKTYYEILETGNHALLLKKDEKQDDEILAVLWEKLFIEFSEANEDAETKKTLRILKDIERSQMKYSLVENFCIALDFEWDEEIVTILRGWGYTLREDQEYYYDDLDRIKREAEGLLLKAENTRKQLPQISENENLTVDDILASYSSIMGFDFDYDKITCRKYLAIKRQINVKIKMASEVNAQNKKNNGK